MLRHKYLREVPLPDGLTNSDIYRALEDTQAFFSLIRERTGIKLSEIIQANNFSGVVSNVFTKMLSNNSVYKSYHDQRFPDLMHEEHPIGLEVKASNKPMKGGEGHNGHSGWHIVVCFEILDVVPQNKIPVSCAKTANYNRIFINLSLTVCQKNGTLFFLCVSEISVIVVLVATDKKRERTTPTTARSFSHP